MRRPRLGLLIVLGLLAAGAGAQGTEKPRAKDKGGPAGSPMSSAPVPKSGSMPVGPAPKGKLGTEPKAKGKLGVDRGPIDPKNRPPRPP
jgi:hypothetical protein